MLSRRQTRVRPAAARARCALAPRPGPAHDTRRDCMPAYRLAAPGRSSWPGRAVPIPMRKTRAGRPRRWYPEDPWHPTLTARSISTTGRSGRSSATTTHAPTSTARSSGGATTPHSTRMQPSGATPHFPTRREPLTGPDGDERAGIATRDPAHAFFTDRRYRMTTAMWGTALGMALMFGFSWRRARPRAV